MAWFGLGQHRDAESQPKHENTEEAALTKAPAAPTVVRLPRASIQVAPISHTVDESADQGSKNLWQVYALVGFMVVRWLWARWKERTDARSDAEDDNF
ncbi:hypothetical protein GOP47_0012363 [Adiantum capillus-veneris]|uniref:Uncharacterized protein n=1 Tax=Adiantum capillus-veneris TaxID=13818 RepID=A0A9D4UR16_ADICA|nr:hypothetical protein GOP47_0012363 [Adiantum capillus-veneris]